MALIPPNADQIALIRQQFNEDPASRAEYLRIIKEWLRQQPHLPDTFDDARLLNFLRNSCFSLERCKKQLDKYFTARTMAPVFFVNRNINRPEFINIRNMVHATVLPEMTPEAYRVVVLTCIKGVEFNPQDILEGYKIATMMIDVRLEVETEGFAGDIFIIDANLANPKIFQNMSPKLCMKFIKVVLESYPIKLKQIHLINMSNLALVMLNVIKPFLKSKIGDRFYMHHNISTLYDHVPQRILPDELGGSAGSMETLKVYWEKLLETYTPWYKEQENVKSDESKRPADLKVDCFSFNTMGPAGSFRQLVID